MPYSLRSYHGFPVQCGVTCNAARSKAKGRDLESLVLLLAARADATRGALSLKFKRWIISPTPAAQ
jgi:hypothetical protein